MPNGRFYAKHDEWNQKGVNIISMGKIIIRFKIGTNRSN